MEGVLAANEIGQILIYRAAKGETDLHSRNSSRLCNDLTLELVDRTCRGCRFRSMIVLRQYQGFSENGTNQNFESSGIWMATLAGVCRAAMRWT